VAVLDVDSKWTVDPDAFYSKSRNTPFSKRALTGRAVLTIVAGAIVHELTVEGGR
jgi:dihydroorotase